ncbi:DUF2306 domain-containing protein [Paenibacillus sp. CF384]|uniref:DUF2306 domain-containing protein n=1 Tax=Paenibacillus sp. CF384 TaxID=1884382 RepID=UPI00089ABC63|nr:DUF2306 domain-containing protein [Paenibacillus sp. CF384]SDX57678.1 Predicted membrane protein [Paenibacillus sp. CF384]
MRTNKRWWILLVVSLGVMIPFMFPYLTFNSDNSRVSISSKAIQYPALVAHICFAFVALLTGWSQFAQQIRRKYPRVHRQLGRVYVGSVFLSGMLSLVVILYVEDFTKAVSFLVLTGLWLFTSWKGYRTAVHRKFDEHRMWMIRSYGVTLVAVCARLAVPILLLTYGVLNGFSLPEGREGMIEEVLNVNIWTAIVIDLVLVEWVILTKRRQ